MITLANLIELNEQICSRANEQCVVINKNNLLSALSVQQWYEGELLAAALVRSITIAHGFQDGNKRTAACIGDFICEYTCTDDEVINCILDIVIGKLKDVNGIASILYS